jgi:hypothetical protein
MVLEFRSERFGNQMGEGEKKPHFSQKTREMGHPNRDRLGFCDSPLDRVAIGVDEVDFADSQLLYTLFDFGAIAHYQPHHAFGVQNFFGGGI